MWTTLEASKARGESRMMDAIKWLTRELYVWIDSFEIKIEERLCEAQVPD